MALSSCSAYAPDYGLEDVRTVVIDRTGISPELISSAVPQRELSPAGTRLTVESAMVLALLHNPRLNAAWTDLGIAAADLSASRLLRNPILHAEGRFGGDGTVVELSLLQNVVDLIYLPLRKRIGAAEFELAKSAVAASVITILGEARNAYYDLVAAKQVEDLRRAIALATDASATLATKLFAAGNITELQKTTEQSLAEESRVALSEAHLETVERHEQFARLLGLSSEELRRYEIPPKLPELPKPELELRNLPELALERSLDIDIANRELDALSLRADASRPFSLFRGLELGGASKREPDGGWTTGPSGSLPLPIFDHGVVAQGRANAEIDRSLRNLQALRQLVVSEARVARAQATAAREQVERLRNSILPLRRKALKETEKQYNAMLVSGFQLVEAKRQEIDAAGRYVLALARYWRAKSNILQLLSGGLPQRMESNFRESIGGNQGLLANKEGH